ncbi:hypothetical protein ACFQES_16995 [Nonomuraea salmonea]|uniref:hypothetical protein n=1 Tax=Nonomuraea salmonea TaxID=46181 RepID=UPI00360D4C52
MRAKLLFGSARALLVREEVVQDDVELLAGPADAGTTFCLTRCSASSVRLQVENAEIFQSAGRPADQADVLTHLAADHPAAACRATNGRSITDQGIRTKPLAAKKMRLFA